MVICYDLIFFYSQNWDEVEKRVRYLAKSVDYSLLVWTGTDFDAGRIPSIITYRSLVEDRPAPRFTWKVNKFKIAPIHI